MLKDILLLVGGLVAGSIETKAISAPNKVEVGFEAETELGNKSSRERDSDTVLAKGLMTCHCFP